MFPSFTAPKSTGKDREKKESALCYQKWPELKKEETRFIA
jgi:hypothetical protein